MPYATAAQLSTHLGEDRYLALVDRNNDDTPDTDGVEQAIARASSIADSYCTRWLPFADPPPDALLSAVLDVATYLLAGNRTTEDERKRYEDQMRWFRDLAAGKASLGVSTGEGDEAQIQVDDAEFGWSQSRRVL